MLLLDITLDYKLLLKHDETGISHNHDFVPQCSPDRNDHNTDCGVRSIWCSRRSRRISAPPGWPDNINNSKLYTRERAKVARSVASSAGTVTSQIRSHGFEFAYYANQTWRRAARRSPAASAKCDVDAYIGYNANEMAIFQRHRLDVI